MPTSRVFVMIKRGKVRPGNSKPFSVPARLFPGLLGGTIGFLAFIAAAQTGAAKSGTAPGDFETNLPIVFLDATAPITSDPKVPCRLKIICPRESESGTTSSLPGTVKFHGATSQAYPKKSFGLTLDAPNALLGMRESAHWVLNAAYIDRSLMRHKISYDLFRSLSTREGKRFAVASRFVELYLNGNYHGAYLLMERVDRQLLELTAYQSNDVSHACIYKAVSHAANFGHPGHAGFEQREPDPLITAHWQPLDEFTRFVSSTPDAQFFHPSTGIESRLDLDNAIDFHLLVLLTSNMDGITKNFILARQRPIAGAPGPRFFFAPWDYDGTFGRNWDASPVAPSAWLSNHLFDRLMANPAYRDRFAARWKQLRQHEFSVKTIHSLIDENARTLGAGAQRNAARWPVAGGPYPDALSFADDIAQMKSWTEARLKWLDQEIQGK